MELRCRSAFSFLEGASNPEDLVDRAAELGHGTLALADRDGLYGAPRFHAAAREAGLRAIVGANASLSGVGRLLLLVESRQGYRNLSRLLTVGQGNAPKGEARVGWDEVETHAGGLTALVRGNGSLSKYTLDRALGVFGCGRVWVDVSRHRDRRAEAENRFAVALAEAAKLPVVASGDVRFARPEGRRLLDAFCCLGEKTSLDRAGRRLLPNGEHYLASPEEMAARFADRREWIRATRAIAERCTFTLEGLGYRFPCFPVPPGESQASWLRYLTFEGARKRYG